MKKILLFLLFIAHAQAQSLVEHNSNRPANLDEGRKLQVINIWATWCAPCRREIPILNNWYKQQGRHMGVQLIGISLDNAAKTQQFLQQHTVRYPIWRYTGQDSTAWMNTLGNPIGGVPFTLVRRNGCTHRQVLFGEISAAQLNRAVTQITRQCATRRS